jgi:hypothetical protein
VKHYALDIRGKRREWTFHIRAEPEHVEEWRADGLQIDEVLNVIPQWYVDLGLPIGLFCAIQDWWNKKEKQ